MIVPYVYTFSGYRKLVKKLETGISLIIRAHHSDVLSLQCISPSLTSCNCNISNLFSKKGKKR